MNLCLSSLESPDQGLCPHPQSPEALYIRRYSSALRRLWSRRKSSDRHNPHTHRYQGVEDSDIAEARKQPIEFRLGKSVTTSTSIEVCRNAHGDHLVDRAVG